MLRILIAEDNLDHRKEMQGTLSRLGATVDGYSDELSLISAIDSGTPYPYDCMIISSTISERWIALIEHLHVLWPSVPIYVTTPRPDVRDAVSALKAGAQEYLEKPLSHSQLAGLLAKLPLTTSSVPIQAATSPAPSAESLQFGEGREMIGRSKAMKEVFTLIRKLSKVDTSVLIRGESGTGKELVARALHANSDRARGPFVAVNCGAIPEALIESELFGHEKGAFTGADRKKPGRFQHAAGGTIFLDEIGDISAAMQVKLLRVLQEKMFTPVGGNVEVKVDVRIISATHKPLEDMIQKGEFRSDLFYRLNVLPITIPPLRERWEDIESIGQHLIEKYNITHSREILGFDEATLKSLKSYPWPGNIREFENVIEHAFIVEPTNHITMSSLPPHIQKAQNLDNAGKPSEHPASERAAGQENGEKPPFSTDFSDLKYPILKERFEKEFIQKALKAFKGRINQTAEHTQMTKVTLLRKLEKYGIDPKVYQK